MGHQPNLCKEADARIRGVKCRTVIRIYTEVELVMRTLDCDFETATQLPCYQFFKALRKARREQK